MPAEFPRQEKVEIIILPYQKKKETQKKFDPREFFGTAHLNMSEEVIDQECQKLRDEWKRDF